MPVEHCANLHPPSLTTDIKMWLTGSLRYHRCGLPKRLAYVKDVIGWDPIAIEFAHGLADVEPFEQFFMSYLQGVQVHLNIFDIKVVFEEIDLLLELGVQGLRLAQLHEAYAKGCSIEHFAA